MSSSAFACAEGAEGAEVQPEWHMVQAEKTLKNFPRLKRLLQEQTKPLQVRKPGGSMETISFECREELIWALHVDFNDTSTAPNRPKRMRLSEPRTAVEQLLKDHEDHLAARAPSEHPLIKDYL